MPDERLQHIHAGSESAVSLTGHRSTALDPELAAYLDWPTTFDENEVWCDKPGCTIGDCADPDPQITEHICSRYSLTARKLLAGIKAHAEGS